MRTLRTSMGIAVALCVAACAKDPYAQVKEARRDEARVERERTEGAAESRKENALETADTRRDVRRDANQSLPEGVEGRANAQADLAHAREERRARFEERLTRAEAKLAEAKTRSRVDARDHVPDTQRALQAAAAQCEVARGRIVAMRDARDAQWGDTVTSAERALDELEALVGRAERAVR